MVHLRSILYGLLLLPAMFLSASSTHAATLKYRVTLKGTHDVDWTHHLRTNTGAGGYVSDLQQEGTEFVDYSSVKPAIMTFKTKRGAGLVGNVQGRGIGKFPLVRANITNGNVTTYSCSGVCPPPPDLTTYGSGCGSKPDTGNVRLRYEFGVFDIDSLHFSDLGNIPGGTQLPLGFDPSRYLMPVGTLAPENCGPTFPPNNPAQDLVDFRYPFLVISSSEILPGKPASAVDRKLKRLKIGKTMTVKFQTTLEPAKTLLFDGSGYSYEGATGVFWTLKLKRLS